MPVNENPTQNWHNTVVRAGREVKADNTEQQNSKWQQTVREAAKNTHGNPPTSYWGKPPQSA